jgi:hypothetical protein
VGGGTGLFEGGGGGDGGACVELFHCCFGGTTLFSAVLLLLKRLEGGYCGSRGRAILGGNGPPWLHHSVCISCLKSLAGTAFQNQAYSTTIRWLKQIGRFKLLLHRN